MAVVTGQFVAELVRQILVKQQLHSRASCNRALGERVGFGIIKQLFDLLALDRWELLEEVVDRPPALEVIKERFNRHASTSKDWRAAEDIGVHADNIEHDGIIADARTRKRWHQPRSAELRHRVLHRSSLH